MNNPHPSAPNVTTADLAEQLRFLALSSAYFDAGEWAEAKRLATAVRTLVHTTKASTSLLRHLDLDNRLRWVTSGWYEPGNLVSTDGLTMMGPGDPQEGDQAYRLFAKTAEEILPMRHAWVDFETWWKQIVIRDQVGREYSRRQIVLFLANKYGGAHYDRPGAADQALLDGSAFGWFYQDEPLFLGENRVLLSMRTIASEVEVVFADEQNALLVPDLPR